MIAALIGVGAMMLLNVAIVAFYGGRHAQKLDRALIDIKDNKKAIEGVDKKLMAHLLEPTKRFTNGDFLE